MQLRFAIRATSEADFWQSWEAAGIVDANRHYRPEYPGIIVYGQDMPSGGWTPTRSTGQVDEDGNDIREAVSGWHANVVVDGPLATEMTYGLAQSGPDGEQLSIFDRTWATNIFNLTWQEADPVSCFPAGYRNAAGTVSYCDQSDFKSPTNVISD